MNRLNQTRKGRSQAATHAERKRAPHSSEETKTGLRLHVKTRARSETMNEKSENECTYSKTVENCSSVGFFVGFLAPNCASVFPVPNAVVDDKPPVMVCNAVSTNSAPDHF